MNAPMLEKIGGAGRGGAGLLTCLKTLGYSASNKGWQMAFTSSYSPETRGGLVEAALAISQEDPILNPVLDTFTTVLAFDKAGYLNYAQRLEPGGLLVWDSSKIDDPPPVDDAVSYGIPIYEMAERAGAGRLANMAMLGIYNKLRGLFTIDELLGGMESYLPPWRHKLLPYNRQILEAVGYVELEEFRV